MDPFRPPLRAADFARVADAYGLGAVVEGAGPTARGELGFVFRLTTDTGTWAVKQLIRPQLEADVVEDVEFVAAARSVGVPTPAMLRTTDGAVLLDLPDSQVRVTEWVDLRDVDPSLDPAAVGAVLGALHRTPFRGSHGEHPWHRDPVGADRWDELTAALAAAGAPFAGDLAATRDELVALERLLTDPHDLRTCHRDLFPENLRSTVAGSVCVIDWDNHGLAGASQELAFVVWCFAALGVGSVDSADRAVRAVRADRARTIAHSYGAAGGPGRLRGPGDFTMLIATLGHITERACTRWLDHPPGDPERDRMVALVREGLDDPLTTSVIADLLDAGAG